MSPLEGVAKVGVGFTDSDVGGLVMFVLLLTTLALFVDINGEGGYGDSGDSGDWYSDSCSEEGFVLTRRIDDGRPIGICVDVR